MDHSVTLSDVVALAKRRGLVYPTSEIYGGLANAYDYGPMGVEIMRHLKDLWWRRFVNQREDIVGLDSQIILHPQTWIASGHVGGFSDPLVEDKITHERFRADHLIKAYQQTQPESDRQLPVESMSFDQMAEYIQSHHLLSPQGNPLTPPKAFNLLFDTSLGVIEGEKNKVYLRGETAQGIFTNFTQVIQSSRVQLPFGIAQMGKSFRNEITQGQFIFRTFEFEQAEIEYFFDPQKTDWQLIFDAFKQSMWSFLVNDLNVSPQHLHWREHDDKERSFYSQSTFDLEYDFPFGTSELWGIAYRTDYDLAAHQKMSGKPLVYTDPQTGTKVLPHVIEPAVGLNRLLLTLLCEHYAIDTTANRTILKLPGTLAPYQVAVFPLLKNKLDLVAKARDVFAHLTPHFNTVFDDRGNIGKRYYSQDEIGTPFCVTIDFDTLKDSTVTVRQRDTGVQDRVAIAQLIEYLRR